MQTILMIDDDQDEFLIFSEVLEKLALPLSCNYLSNPSMALEWLKENEVDFILVDMMMPKINGIELMQQIKLLPNTSKIKFVIFSTYIDDTLCEKAIANGAIKCIQKPDTVKAFADVLKIFFTDYQ